MKTCCVWLQKCPKKDVILHLLNSCINFLLFLFTAVWRIQKKLNSCIFLDLLMFGQKREQIDLFEKVKSQAKIVWMEQQDETSCLKKGLFFYNYCAKIQNQHISNRRCFKLFYREQSERSAHKNSQMFPWIKLRFHFTQYGFV